MSDDYYDYVFKQEMAFTDDEKVSRELFPDTTLRKKRICTDSDGNTKVVNTHSTGHSDSSNDLMPTTNLNLYMKHGDEFTVNKEEFYSNEHSISQSEQEKRHDKSDYDDYLLSRHNDNDASAQQAPVNREQTSMEEQIIAETSKQSTDIWQPWNGLLGGHLQSYNLNAVHSLRQYAESLTLKPMALYKLGVSLEDSSGLSVQENLGSTVPSLHSSSASNKKPHTNQAVPKMDPKQMQKQYEGRYVVGLVGRRVKKSLKKLLERKATPAEDIYLQYLLVTLNENDIVSQGDKDLFLSYVQGYKAANYGPGAMKDALRKGGKNERVFHRCILKFLSPEGKADFDDYLENGRGNVSVAVLRKTKKEVYEKIRRLLL